MYSSHKKLLFNKKKTKKLLFSNNLQGKKRNAGPRTARKLSSSYNVSRVAQFKAGREAMRRGSEESNDPRPVIPAGAAFEAATYAVGRRSAGRQGAHATETEESG